MNTQSSRKSASFARYGFWPLIVLLILGLAVKSDSAVTILGGTATAGADSGGSWVPDVAPVNRSFNVFYDTKNLATVPSGSLEAQGWASTVWSIGPTRLYAAGGSSQGFNGALGGNGLNYVWGHARFSATIRLDGVYKCSSVSTPSNVRGIRGTNVFLTAGTYTFTAITYGNSGGYWFDYQLTPANTAENQVLNGAISRPMRIWDSARQRYYIRITFQPQNGADLQTAASILGIDHFNFVNTITSIPPDWQVMDNGQLVVPGNGTFPFEGLPDPVPHAASGGGRWVVSQRFMLVHVNTMAGVFDDTTGAYYNEEFVTKLAQNNPTELEFQDSPSVPPGIFRPGEYIGFSTQLVGEDANGNIVAYFGTPSSWWSDQVATDKAPASSGALHFSTLLENTNLNSIVAGEINLGSRPPMILWNPSTIVYGTPLGSNQLNAVATVPGWFSYSPTNGTLLSAGTNILTAVFHPDDPAAYDSVTNSGKLVVTPAPLTVIAANASRAYGVTNPALAGTISGVTNGDNISAVYICNAVTNSPVGVYPIKPILIDPNHRAGNYTVTAINGSLTVGGQAGNLLQNPGFEQTSSGWILNGNSGITPAPHTGTYAAFVNIATGRVVQEVATVPGDSYLVSFWLSANGFSKNGALISVSFAGVTGFSNSYPSGAFSYQSNSFTTKAIGTNSLLAFSGLMNGGTFFFDDFSVTHLATQTNGISITSQAASESVHIGESASFQVAVVGDPPLSYQWFFNQTNRIESATNNTFVLPSVLAANAGDYNVVVTGPYGSAFSAPATLNVLGVPAHFVTASDSPQFKGASLSAPISGLTGQGIVVVEASSNLSEWKAIFTNRPSFGTIQFVDTNVAIYPHRFYRITIVAP